MKKTTAEDLTDDLRPHYDFDYSKMKRNRFAGMKLSAPIYRSAGTKRTSKRTSSKKRAP
jgi:hypothetical protein